MESDPSTSEPGLRIGELAERTGVSRDTLRFYERRGLLPIAERGANGYRRYPPVTVERVLWIRQVLKAGFTLDELASILAERRRGGVPCRRVRALGAAKLAELEERQRELAAAAEALRGLLAEWDRRLEGTVPGERAGLLDALAARLPQDSTPHLTLPRSPLRRHRPNSRRERR